MKYEEDEILDTFCRIFDCAIEKRVRTFYLKHNLMKYLNTGGQLALDSLVTDKSYDENVESIFGLKVSLQSRNQTYRVIIKYKKENKI